jgi:hypothetical protein
MRRKTRRRRRTKTTRKRIMGSSEVGCLLEGQQQLLRSRA